MIHDIKEEVQRLTLMAAGLNAMGHTDDGLALAKAIDSMTRLSEECVKRKQEDDLHKDHRGDFHSVYDELNALRSFVSSEGYRRCDVAACNCGSWHDHSPTGYIGLNQKIDDLERLVEELSEKRELPLVCGLPYGSTDENPLECKHGCTINQTCRAIYSSKREALNAIDDLEKARSRITD